MLIITRDNFKTVDERLRRKNICPYNNWLLVNALPRNSKYSQKYFIFELKIAMVTR